MLVGTITPSIPRGSRLISPKGTELLKSINNLGFNIVSSGHPTYWPTDRAKLLNLIDFCITKGIADTYIKSELCLKLTSDNTSVMVKIAREILIKPGKCTLHNKMTDWSFFRDLLNISLNKVKLKNEEDIVIAVELFNTAVQKAAWESSPPKKPMKPS